MAIKKSLTVANGAKSSALCKIGNSKLMVSSASFEFYPLMHNVPKWSNALAASKCCKIFKVHLTILGYYALKR